MDGFADRSAELLLLAIEQRKHVPLERFLLGLGIRQVGQHIARVLVRHFHSLQAIIDSDCATFEAVHEIGPEIAASLESYFQEPGNRVVLKKLFQVGVHPQEEPGQSTENTTTQGALEGKSFVFTGGLSGMTREEAIQRVVALGGRATTNVSNRTDYVVVGQEPGSKATQAEGLGVLILSEAEFVTLLEKHSNQTL